MAQNEPLMRTRSRSDASDQQRRINLQSGRIRYPGGPLNRRTRLTTILDISWKSADNESKAESMENIRKTKEIEDEKFKQSANASLGRTKSVTIGAETGDALRKLTHRRIEELKADYPVRYEFDLEGETERTEFPEFPPKLILRKTNSAGKKLPTIGRHSRSESFDDFQKRFTNLHI